MSTITHYEINNIFSNQCLCQDSLKDKLTIQNTINKENIVSVFTNEGKPQASLNNLLNDNERKVSNTNWNVLYKGSEFNNERFDKLEKKMEKMDEKIKSLNTKVNCLDNVVIKLVETPIRNTASNIILFFLGEQPKGNSNSHRFTENTGNLDLLEDFIEKKNIENNKKILGKEFDKIITSRNKCIHPSDLEELANEVEKCKQYIKEYPQLTIEFKYEVFIIEHYDDFIEYYLEYKKLKN
jgi:hypothetical protein